MAGEYDYLGPMLETVEDKYRRYLNVSNRDAALLVLAEVFADIGDSLARLVAHVDGRPFGDGGTTEGQCNSS